METVIHVRHPHISWHAACGNQIAKRVTCVTVMARALKVWQNLWINEWCVWWLTHEIVCWPRINDHAEAAVFLTDKKQTTHASGQPWDRPRFSRTCARTSTARCPLTTQHLLNRLQHVDWAELWLVKKNMILPGSKSGRWRKLSTLLDFGSFLKVPKIEGKSSAHPVGVFCMQPNPPKCHIRQKSRKSAI